MKETVNAVEKIVERAKLNIRQALKDYAAHTVHAQVMHDVSNAFIHRLAVESTKAKQGLRKLFSKSPVWCADLDALIINGSRTYDPNPVFIEDTAMAILRPAVESGKINRITQRNLAYFFAASEDERKAIIDTFGLGLLERIAPKAYAPGKKLSRVFKAICVALGVDSDEQFNALFAKFADELSAKKIDFKLFVSINPGHFLTMSNPKFDRRGDLLISCHSFNFTDYSYNNGCVGYARDNCTFIVFTVKDPSNSETLNNRKITRQIFAYQPGNGLLLQSRMYNTKGGVSGTVAESKLYRDLIQREISALEGVPNLWVTHKYKNGYESTVEKSSDFGGYPDWIHTRYNARVSVRNDCAESYQPLIIGKAGLCIKCGREITDGLYCVDCGGDERHYCECCKHHVHGALVEAYDEHGNCIHVCEQCLESHFVRCSKCGRYKPFESMTYYHGDVICDSCLHE